MDKPKLGISGDFVGSGTGFAEVLLNITNNLFDKYQVSQLAVNYSGDYSEHQKNIRLYACDGKDPYGMNKLHWYIEREKLDLLLVLNDAWIADKIILKVREKYPNLKTVLYTPVDSDGVDSSYVSVLNMYDAVIAYTEYGKRELQAAGLSKQCYVIPHGVDTNTFYPVDKQRARADLEFGEKEKSGFIVGYLAQNQARKKVDHFIWVFNEWMKKYPHDDTFFYYHGPVKRSGGINVFQYIKYLDSKNKGFCLADRFITTTDDPKLIVGRDMLRDIIGTWDLFVQAAACEGWGMGLHQAMAMRKPAIVPEYSALVEWPRDGVFYVPTLDIPNIYESNVNTDHKVFDPYWMVEALEELYQNKNLRTDLGNKAYEVATQPKFLWPNIAQEFDHIFTALLNGKELVQNDTRED